MENILIVDAFSTGINYIDDVVNRNYKPIVLYENLPEKHLKTFDDWRARVKNKYKDVAIFIDEQKTFEETVELVKEYNPKFILPGSEGGVILAMKLTGALGLLGNDVEKIPNFTQKDAMQEALKKAGIRYIKGELVNSLEEALNFFDTNELKGCVIKPAHGAGSVGVRICNNRDELIRNFEEIFSSVNVFGEEIELLIQEKIDGTEFIVNTVSYNGVHRLASIWKYEKRVVEGGGKVYDYFKTINTLETGCTRLIRYAFDTLDALGFKYGGVHGEYMVDEKGPVLIETNCRPMGAGMSASYADSLFGHHESDNILDSYLNPEWHYQKAKEPYVTYNHGVIKTLITKEDSKVSVLPILDIIRHLRSYYSAELSSALSGILPRTVDLETSSGTIFLSHEDPMVIHQDLEFIRKIEKDYFNIFFNNDTLDVQKPDNMDTVESIIKKYNCVRGIIVLTNDEGLNVNAVVTNEKNIDDIKHMFNYGIIDLTNPIGTEEYIDLFYRLTSHIRKGGKIIVPLRSYWHFPHTVEGIEALCEANDLEIEAPTVNDKDVIIISKK